MINSLPKASQHLVVLLFGTLSRTLSHAHENGMTAESLAVSIAPSVITTCTKQPLQISKLYDSNMDKLLLLVSDVRHLIYSLSLGLLVSLPTTKLSVCISL